MKKSTILIILVILIAGSVGLYFWLNRYKDKYTRIDTIPADRNFIDPYPTTTSVVKTDPNKEFFRKMGYGSSVLDTLSTKDAATARQYVVEYLNKGKKILPNDKLWNDVTRIATYSKLFLKPVFNVVMPLQYN